MTDKYQTNWLASLIDINVLFHCLESCHIFVPTDILCLCLIFLALHLLELFQTGFFLLGLGQLLACSESRRLGWLGCGLFDLLHVFVTLYLTESSIFHVNFLV